MHMPGKGLGAAEEGVGEAGVLGAAPEAVSCPSPPTVQAVPQCAAPSSTRTVPTRRWVRGEPPPHPGPIPIPHPALTATPTQRRPLGAGGPDPGACGRQTPCCGRTRAAAPTRAPARATPRSSPWCGCPAAPLPATWPGNTTAARPTSREPGGGPWAGRGGTSVRTQGWETRLPIAPQLRGLWASGSTFLSWVLLKNGLPHHQPPSLPGLMKGPRDQRTGHPFLPAACTRGVQKTLSSSRENVLALDIFFEALNYEAVEQKKAYEMSELLGVSAPTCSERPAAWGEAWAGRTTVG